MNDLTRLEELEKEYALHKAAFHDYCAAANALMIEVQERIRRDQVTVTSSMAGRVAELEARRDDPERDQSVRRIAGAVADALVDTSEVRATAEELEAIRAAILRVRDEQAAMLRVRQETFDLYLGIKSKIGKLKEATYGDPGQISYEPQLEKLDKRLDRLERGRS